MTYQTWNRQEYNTSDSAAQGYYQGNYGYGCRCYSKPLDIHSALMPLISQIRKYDALRLKLECEGGNVAHLNENHTHPKRGVQHKGPFRREKVAY
jgi:hypothetical protein